MRAQILNCTVVEQRILIRFFLWSESFKTYKIYRRMLAKYDEKCMAQGIILLHDDTRPHSAAAATVEAIR